MFKKLLIAAVATGTALFASVGAQAAGYPDKTVRLVVPCASDILARVLSQKLSESLGQQLMVDNKLGAGGSSIARIIQLPYVRARWTQLGAEPIANTPAQFASWLDAESLKWARPPTPRWTDDINGRQTGLAS